MVLLAIRSQVLIYTTLLSSLSFFCIFKPSIIVNQGTVMLLSDALDLPYYPYSAKTLAPAGLLLAVLSLMYFVIYVRDDMALLSVLAPMRFLMSTAICGWGYFTKDTQLGNGLVFGLAFGDVVFQV